MYVCMIVTWFCIRCRRAQGQFRLYPLAVSLGEYAHACGTPPAGHVLLFLFLFLFRHGHALVRQLQAWLCSCHCFPWPGMGSVSHLTTSMRASTVATGSLLGLGLPACKLRCAGSAQ